MNSNRHSACGLANEDVLRQLIAEIESVDKSVSRARADQRRLAGTYNTLQNKIKVETQNIQKLRHLISMIEAQPLPEVRYPSSQYLTTQTETVVNLANTLTIPKPKSYRIEVPDLSQTEAYVKELIDLKQVNGIATSIEELVKKKQMLLGKKQELESKYVGILKKIKVQDDKNAG